MCEYACVVQPGAPDCAPPRKCEHVCVYVCVYVCVCVCVCVCISMSVYECV